MQGSLKILMLEDSEIDAEIIQRMLLKEKPFVEFRLVMNREEFLEGLNNFHPDLILSDNTLPQFDATEALEIFNQRSLHIPFILVTGTVSEEFAAGIIKLGADDYILKDRLIRLPGAIDAALQKKKTEAAIRHSENVRKLIMNSALDAIVCIDTSGLITVWNPQAEKLFGWKEEEILGKNFANIIISSQYRELREDGLGHYFKDGNHSLLNKVIEITGINRSGIEFPIELAIVPIKQTGDDFFCAFIRDISERKKAEDKLRFNASLLNTVGQAVIATDINGIIIYWNNAAEKVYGWTEAEAIGVNIIDLTPAQQSKEQANEIMETLINGNIWSGEFFVKRKDGSDFPVYITDSPIYDHEGTLTGIIGVSVDITERKKAEAVLKSMEKKILDQKIEEQKKISRAIIKGQEQERNRIGQELHDNINQILAGTKMYLSMAAKKNEALKESIKYPMELIDSSIEEIRLLSRKQVTPLKNINLEELVKEILISLSKNTSTKTSLSYHIPIELTDDLKLNIYRIIQELVNNIMKHADAKNVSITLNTDNDHINLLVTDDGKGFNVNSKRKGIGISNMINRIETYNGTVAIESNPGEGARTSVKLPYQNTNL